MTIIEMMVAIAILAIGMSAFSFLLSRSVDENRSILSEGAAATQASHVVNRIVSDIRRVQQADNGDFPIESADDFDFVMYADIDEDGSVERIHYYLDLPSDRLYQGITKPTATVPITYPSADGNVSVLAEHVVNSSSQPIFSYYARSYSSDADTLDTPADIGYIRFVRIRLLVDIDPSSGPDSITIESFANMRNLNAYDE